MSPATEALVGKEFAQATRSRWLAGFVAAFLGLGVALMAAGAWGSAFGGAAGFGRTTAALINLILLIVPLMGLLAGALSLSGERERRTLEFLLALPVRPEEVFWAKFIGGAWALWAALAMAFSALGAVLALSGGLAHAGAYASCFAATLLLAAVSLAMGLAVSAACARTAAAAGCALLAWLALVLGGDLGLLGTSLAVRLPPGALLASAWLNPMSLFRLLAVDSAAAGLDVLGPAGHCAQDALGSWLRPLAFAGLGAWLAAGLWAARAIFCRRPLEGALRD
ncbi:MAG: ABC transporter permease subunit [Elusimicrobia bacterium]|nr:ABC transporter permease subunit [Elusimicrobiota bacterium]